MRIPVALRATLGLMFLAQFASAAPEPSAAAEPSAAPPAPAPAPAPVPAPNAAAPAPTSATPAPATTSAPAADPPPAAAASDAGPVVVPAEDAPPALEPIPKAHDTLGGHFVLGLSAGAKWQFGNLDTGAELNDRLGTALALNLDLGYGVSRNVVLGVWGEFDDHSKPSNCISCNGGKSFAGGPFIRYHLVQGTRFDPWGSFALGVRSTTVDSRLGPSDDYFGMDIMKLSLGGDWYPTSNLGFGPYVAFNWGTYGSSGGHTGLATGLRIVLDLPGK